LGAFQSAGASFGLTAVPLELRHENEIDTVIAAFAGARGDGIVAESDSFITVHRERILAAVNRHHLPAIYASTIHASAGGLLSYGVETEQQWLAAAGYVDRILRGEKAGNLPVQQPTKFVLAVNLRPQSPSG